MAALAPVGDGVNLRRIAGVGDYIAGRIQARHGIADTLQLAAYVNALDTRAQIQAFLDDVTANPRACQCLEGYVVRRFNRNAREGLVDWFVRRLDIPHGRRPHFSAPPSTRKPPPPGMPGNPVPGTDGRRFYRRTVLPGGGQPAVEGGWAFPYARPAHRAIPTNPATAQGVATYPYGRHNYKGSALADAPTRAARDAIIRNPAADNAAYNRRYWPCPCFRHKETCQDFNPGRHNRPGGGLPPCRWAAGKCHNAAAP